MYVDRHVFFFLYFFSKVICDYPYCISHNCFLSTHFLILSYNRVHILSTYTIHNVVDFNNFCYCFCIFYKLTHSFNPKPSNLLLHTHPHRILFYSHFYLYNMSKTHIFLSHFLKFCELININIPSQTKQTHTHLWNNSN